MRWIWLIVLCAGLCGCENQKLAELQRQTNEVQAERKLCEMAIKAVEHERAKTLALKEKEAALKGEIAALKAARSKKTH